MGPPLASWRKEIKVFRHGEPCCTHMLTQVAEKAPKWTIPGKPKDPPVAPAPGPGFTNPPDKYPREPAYTMRGAPQHPRPASAPGLRNLPLNPTTPKWGFGTCPRPDPFAPSGPSGHGPDKLPAPPRGPKYSIGGRPQRKRPKSAGPGPNDYRPRRPGSARVTGWGKAPEGRDGPASAPGPGPPLLAPVGPSYSMRPQLDQKSDDHWRQLGPPWTYFGYNDFGHSGCENCWEPDYGILVQPFDQTKRTRAGYAPGQRHGEGYKLSAELEAARARTDELDKLPSGELRYDYETAGPRTKARRPSSSPGGLRAQSAPRGH